MTLIIRSFKSNLTQKNKKIKAESVCFVEKAREINLSFQQKKIPDSNRMQSVAFEHLRLPLTALDCNRRFPSSPN